MSKNILAGKIEAILFAAGTPLGIGVILEKLCITTEQLNETLNMLDEIYQKEIHGIFIRRTHDTLQLVTKREYSYLIKEILAVKNVKLSNAALETLSIIAFNNSATKTEIESIRGVKVDSVLATLLEYNLIKEIGRKETIGKPIIYAITDKFLNVFGLDSLDELPKLPDSVMSQIKNIEDDKSQGD
jgi:segregation and condensation protein B